MDCAKAIIDILRDYEHVPSTRFWSDYSQPPELVTVLSDASRSSTGGYGAHIGATETEPAEYLFRRFTTMELEQDILSLELAPLVDVLRRFGPRWRGRVVAYTCDNAGCAFALARGSSTSPFARALLLDIAALEVAHNLSVVGLWCPRDSNSASDWLSKAGSAPTAERRWRRLQQQQQQQWRRQQHQQH